MSQTVFLMNRSLIHKKKRFGVLHSSRKIRSLFQGKCERLEDLLPNRALVIVRT
jgi:hypothetical protein